MSNNCYTLIKRAAICIIMTMIVKGRAVLHLVMLGMSMCEDKQVSLACHCHRPGSSALQVRY